MNRRKHQRGIALITTLIMLSVVTLMAVAFLAVSRRERASVTTSTDRQDAKAMADAAVQRAEAEVISRVLAASNVLNYDLLVSTNLINPRGYIPNDTNVYNVSYQNPSGGPLSNNDLLEMLQNLQVDARPPVFVAVKDPASEQRTVEDFRFYLDYNRNQLFETNGVFREVVNDAGSFVPGGTNFHIGDPEWIGVLRRPDQPHSASNHFVGRYAYLVVPIGKTLDINFIHNRAKKINAILSEGFYRNQGVGGWEINLAAFLRDLNTNEWPKVSYDYRFGDNSAASPSSGFAFDDAFFLLNYRYDTNFNKLNSVTQLYGQSGSRAYLGDGIDGYSDGPVQFDVNRRYTGTNGNFIITEDDETNRPWPGSDNPVQFFDLEAMFGAYDDRSVINNGRDTLTYRLLHASTNRTTYDRHTFYRLLGQLGTDSITSNRSKINLTYDNRLDFNPGLVGLSEGVNVGYHATNFVRWTPIAFFTNAADRILKATHPPFGQGIPLLAVTNIGIWPTNYYSPAVHRSLQLAANLFDATTNRYPGISRPEVPSVFRPVFGVDRQFPKGIAIVDYEDITEDWESKLWQTAHYDIDESESRPNIKKYERIAGIPVVIGAKKGYPNFNEFFTRSVVTMGRKLELVKKAPAARPSFTNQLYTIGISNVFGLEFWNSYTQAFGRQLELRARLEIEIVLSNDVKVIQTYKTTINHSSVIQPDQWQGGQFQIPIRTNILFVPTSLYQVRNGGLVPLQNNRLEPFFESAVGFPLPTLRLNVTNRLQAALIAENGGRRWLVEYVDLDNLGMQIDIARELYGNTTLGGTPSASGQFWSTNRSRPGAIPEGVALQIQASLGDHPVDWNSASSETIPPASKALSIRRFREFMGFGGNAGTSPTLRMQAPFSPGRKISQEFSWQVNDPLVNDLIWDLIDPRRSTNVVKLLDPNDPVVDEAGGLGEVNRRHQPWGNRYRRVEQVASVEVGDYDTSVKDPQITRSDDWDFPTNAFPSLGWIGRVHRGTPWQTVYLKSQAVIPETWRLWSGHLRWIWPGNIEPLGTQPTNDWRLLDLFTTSINDNAARGQLSVNQSGIAAWSAVLSGVPIFTNSAGGPIASSVIQPATPELSLIVDGINRERELRLGRRFSYMGEVLSTPELTERSPYVQVTKPELTPIDPVLERIPQMTLSLLRADQPRFAVYAYGQSLRPAPGSVITDFGRFFQMPTNYIITGEYVTKTLIRLDSSIERDPVSRQNRLSVRPVKEAFNEVPLTE
ncbi:MAG: hypothetical protein IT581_05635 [Verrucomicrobiales bacterium]|nr:hypothetical protein [Verrucomicrobiales bacterium]